MGGMKDKKKRKERRERKRERISWGERKIENKLC
jgi:hypothetical protein